jgi:hypothetical protein
MATTALLPTLETRCPQEGQDLLLSRTVISRREVALRGPFSLRLASACRAGLRSRSLGPAQPRARASAMPRTLAPRSEIVRRDLWAIAHKKQYNDNIKSQAAALVTVMCSFNHKRST